MQQTNAQKVFYRAMASYLTEIRFFLYDNKYIWIIKEKFIR